MINFDCKKCIHFSVCRFKDEVTDEIKVYNSRTEENEILKLNLDCKYYETEGLEFIKRK